MNKAIYWKKEYYENEKSDLKPFSEKMTFDE